MKKVFLVLISILSFTAGYQSSTQRNSNEDLRGKKLLNREEIKEKLGFKPKKNPYPKLWYDTEIDTSRDCYVQYNVLDDGLEDRTQYNLLNMKRQVCSNLDDLYVYLNKTDLASPVSKCAVKLIDRNSLKCLRKIGFSKDCARIWFWKGKNTRKLKSSGGCLFKCLSNYGEDNIEPKGKDNPCKPPEEGGKCKNTINGEPACKNYQLQNGEYRLNPCLQRDECRSGPIFQKIAGRTRRNGGIESAIQRPDVIPIDHNYG
eukprot:maker-scaffold_8-snap-gene-1.42-mRNA-1 protein AED:0.33 eAED:0.35 QI:0/0/0/0.75/0.33/0.25/4/0/258